LRRGVRLEDGARTAPAEIKRLDETKTNAWFEVVLREGRNQQIRRMFDLIGHSVLKLRRAEIGPVKAEGLPVGAWRHLAPAEVARLKGGAKKGGKKGSKAKDGRQTSATSEGRRAGGKRRR
jgi:23S rRNA pseudouridine2605 synthase